jgi:hypothetical protein
MSELVKGLPKDIERLSQEVLRELRRSRGSGHDTLNSAQQRAYDELGAQCLDFLVQTPEAADLLGKLGPHEEAYGLGLLRVDGAILRVNYYSAEGARTINDAEFATKPVDIATFGTPHDHAGHISAVVPAGRLKHHTFRPTDGNEYTAGRIVFDVNNNPSQPHIRRTTFVPSGSSGLAHVGSAEFDPHAGYWMSRDAIHVASWPVPTITVFFNDMKDPHPTTVYQAPGITEEVERPRGLNAELRTKIWGAFVDLASKKVQD